MDPNLLPTTEDGMLDHIVEECSELIKAVIKIKRFGLDSRSNHADLVNEASDVEDSVANYLRFKFN